MNRPLFAWGTALGVYLTTHLLFLGTNPGLHYDEAWAANFSLKIAQTPGFWPVQAMSSQTHAWHHYLIAAVFRIFGSSVEIFRLSHVLMGLGGVVLLGKGLGRRINDHRLGPSLVFLAGLQPALVTNHRFAIELTSFHSLCFGAMIFFTLNRRPWSPFIAAFFAAIGVSSHVFFVAPALALVLTVLCENSHLTRRLRWAITFGLFLCFPIIIKLQTSLPEKDKALALLVVFVLATTATWLLPIQLLSSKILRISRILGFFALPFGLFLFEGNWGILAHIGSLQHLMLVGTGLFPLILLRYYKWIENNQFVTFWCFLAVLTLSISPKPTGRYFETLFLSSLVLMAPAWFNSSLKVRALLMLWPLTLALNLFIPASIGQFINRDYRFLIFHDRSTDFLPKQQAMQKLLAQGCHADQVSGIDNRIHESIQFILAPNSNRSDCLGKSFQAFADPDGLRIKH